MISVATDYLDSTVVNFGNKVAFADDNNSITFLEIKDKAYHIAQMLINKGINRQPVVVFLEKSVECIPAFQGIAYSGNFYVPIDVDMPTERILKIMQQLSPAAVITDSNYYGTALQFSEEEKVFCNEEIYALDYDEETIQSVASRVLDTDILYVLFTSGSTGNPKGVMISHKGLVDFTEWAAETFHCNENNVIANQTPFYFSMSIFDIYQTLRNGSTTYIVPKKLFAQPVKLMAYLDEKKVDTLDWVPSALSYISTLRALNCPHLDNLKIVLFGGEVFQTKQLNRWIAEYPDVRFVNIYGPTEVTDTCTYYEVDRSFSDNEALPAGKACRNKEIILLDENDKLVVDVDAIGEICVRGSGLSYGYYNDADKTNEVFVQNPLNTAFKEIIYRTGDLGKMNEYGELVYVSRKDYQIKHKGHRIELSEIETVCSAIDGIEECCCVYDSKKQQIVFFFVGEMGNDSNLVDKFKEILPDYMIPGKRIKLSDMPKNLNGKIDRKALGQRLSADI